MARKCTALGDIQAFVDFYKETGPNSLAYNLLPKVDVFSQEGYLVMLLGMNVSYERLLSSTGAEDENAINLLKRGNMFSAMQGISSDGLIVKLSEPDWQWS